MTTTHTTTATTTTTLATRTVAATVTCTDVDIDDFASSESECSFTAHSSLRTCDHCNASGVRLYACSRCVGRPAKCYCGTTCQRIDWKLGHKHECGFASSTVQATVRSDDQTERDAQRAGGELVQRLRASITALKLQREGRAIGRASGFRPRDKTETKKEKVHYDPAPKIREWAGQFDGGHKINHERGIACQGQGKRHHNPPARSQPKQGGGKQAKWSNPNPSRSSAAARSSAAKAKKNFKQRL